MGLLSKALTMGAKLIAGGAVATDLFFEDDNDSKKEDTSSATHSESLDDIDIKDLKPAFPPLIASPLGVPIIHGVVETIIKKVDRRSLKKKLEEDDNMVESAAHMARDVYNNTSGYIPNGWTESHEFDDLPLNQKNGLRSRVYRRYHNGKWEYMYATAGTESLEDWKNNGTQLVGMSDQYDAARKNAKAIAKRVRAQGGEIYFTGHSQGGGQATVNAQSTGGKAIVFNPAGTSTATKARYGLHIKKSDVEVYASTNDPLTTAQDASELFGADGERHYVPSKKTGPSHSMDDMIEDLRDVQYSSDE